MYTKILSDDQYEMKMMNQNLLFGYFGPKFGARLGQKKKNSKNDQFQDLWMNSSYLKPNNWLKYDGLYLTDPFELKLWGFGTKK